MIESPHENRFISFNEPELWTKKKFINIYYIIVRRIRAFSLERLTGRDKNNMYSSMILSPDYAPNFENCKRRIALSIIPFTKVLPRKFYQG